MSVINVVELNVAGDLKMKFLIIQCIIIVTTYNPYNNVWLNLSHSPTLNGKDGYFNSPLAIWICAPTAMKLTIIIDTIDPYKAPYKRNIKLVLNNNW